MEEAGSQKKPGQLRGHHYPKVWPVLSADGKLWHENRAKKEWWEEQARAGSQRTGHMSKLHRCSALARSEEKGQHKPSLYVGGNWGSERYRDLPRVSEQGKAKIKSLDFFFTMLSCLIVSKPIARKCIHLYLLPTPQMLLGTWPCAEALWPGITYLLFRWFHSSWADNYERESVAIEL